jgi:hypothetical protein
MKFCLQLSIVCGVLAVCGLPLLSQESSTSLTSAIAVRDNGTERIPPVVIGLPYSSVTETETHQTLADGTRIDRKMERDKTYRDSQGRTRMEHYLPTGLANSDPPTFGTVMIRDPVAGVSYFLNPRQHTAREMPLHLPRANENGTVVSHLEVRSGPANNRPHAKITVEDLGTQVIEGLAVEGKKTTMTFPVDFEGNDKPFDTVTERWFSNELKTYILIKTTDPRSGEHTIKTTITDRGEPDPSLFQVPPDYTITQP